MSALLNRVAEGAAQPAPEAVVALAAELAREADAAAVLFYGSNLRTGSLEGVLDLYVLTRTPHRRGVRGWVERGLWPEIAFVERAGPTGPLRAKVATLPLAVFADAATGGRLDTTIWARFVQPSALVFAADAQSRAAVEVALAAAARTAAGFALALGPWTGAAEAYWRALFHATYATELRVEGPGRADGLVAHDPAHYAALLPLAWAESGLAFTSTGAALEPRPTPEQREALLNAWCHRRRWGRTLNLARLVKAAFVTQGAFRYAAWKLERHRGARGETNRMFG